MTSATSLAASFPAHTEADWYALVAKRGRSADALAAKNADGIPVGPIYGRAADGTVIAGRRPGAAWAIVERVGGDVAEAARQAHAAIAGGANGIAVAFDASAHPLGSALPVSAADKLAGAIGDMLPEGCHVHLDAGEATPAVAEAFVERGAAKRWRLVLAFDPIAAAASKDLIAAIAAIARSFDARAIDGAVAIADGRPWHAAGASEAQELAAALAAFVALLRPFEADGLPVDRAASRIGVALAADTDQFLTIAKFRAARLLLGRLFKVAGLGGALPSLHAETALGAMSRDDPHSNIVRATVAAFAAAVGGADSIAVLPFDTATDGGNDGLAHRIARNTQTILAEEAHIHRVADPAAGSGAVETLTAALAETAWRRFQEIEAADGIAAAIARGLLPRPSGRVS